MNFRTKLIVTLIPLTVGLMAAFVVGSYRIASETILREQHAHMEGVVRRTLTELSQWLADRERDAMLFSLDPVFMKAGTGQELAEAQRRLETFHRLCPVYENMFVADTNGTILVDSIGGKSVGVEVGKHPDYAINIQHAQAGRLWVGDARKSPATGRPVALVTAPILDAQQRWLGVLGTPIELTAFSEAFLSRTTLGKSGYVAVTDSTGLTLAHKNPEYILKVNIAEYDFGKTILAQRNGHIDYTFNGEARLAQFAGLDAKDWMVMAIVPKAEILAGLARIKTVSALMIFLALVVISTAIWLGTRSVFRGIRRLVAALSDGARQTAAAASQVSGASQSLAQGASEQAAALEETSASLEEMSSMTRRNADNARQANTLAKEARQAADTGAGDMHAMSQAMQEIKESSDDIAKIIRTIDEIAFQTNLLALNAAVEAARAGAAGMGFAVVAEEVRRLAQRSAQAARETAAKIEGAISKTTHGVQLSERVARSLREIVAKARQVDQLVAEVASASKEQSQGIGQVTDAVTQMDKVTQSNAASAEESASAAAELNAQAGSLQEAVADLLGLIEGDRGGSSWPLARGLPNSAPATGPSANLPAMSRVVTPVQFAAGSNGHQRGRMAAAGDPAPAFSGTAFRDF